MPDVIDVAPAVTDRAVFREGVTPIQTLIVIILVCAMAPWTVLAIPKLLVPRWV